MYAVFFLMGLLKLSPFFFFFCLFVLLFGFFGRLREHFSLTSCVGKVMERMINTRLMWHLETNNFIAKEQAGFSQNRSTEDQAACFAQKVEDGFQEKTRHFGSVDRYGKGIR